MIYITTKKNQYTLKSSFDELEKGEMLQLCFLLQNGIFELSEKEANAIRIAAFSVLSTMPKKEIDNIEAHQWVDIIKKLNWIFDAPKLSRNLLPVIKIRWRKFYGPLKHDMESSTAMEFITTDTAMIQMAKNKDIAQLYMMCAILYRPKRKDWREFKASTDYTGDLREPLNRIGIVKRAAYFQKHLPIDQAVYVLQYFKGFRHHVFMKRHANLFDGQNKSAGKGIDFGWHGVILEFSDGKFGNYGETAKTNWQLFFMEMSRQVQLAKEREDKK